MQEREPRAVAAYRVEFERLGRRVSGTTEDVSRSGLFVRTSEFLPAGEVVELFVYVDEVLPVRVVARVAHVLSHEAARALGREPGMGFELLEQDPVRLDALRRQLASHLGEAQAARARVPVTGIRAVVAEEGEPLLRRLSTALHEAGFAVRTARNGAEAYSACLTEPPDVLLSADRMPLMDGWTLLKRLRAHPMLARIPVVLMTDQGSELARLTAYRMGARDFIEKPFTDEEIILRLVAVSAQTRRTAESVILRGRIAEVGLGTLLSLLDFERKSGLLLLLAGGDVATLFIAEGRVVKVDPTPDHLTPTQRLLEILDWSEGRFEFIASDVVGRDEIALPTSRLLLEHARLRDEGVRAGDDD
ncbi:MAG TPA: response regulator [Kofleriaceae bacterium]|nr:response regulator [Kofleriaceae bacterium]